MNTDPSLNPPSVPPVERLAFSATETAAALGISKVSLWRLSRRGLIRPIGHLRIPLYAKSEIERFLRTGTK